MFKVFETLGCPEFFEDEVLPSLLTSHHISGLRSSKLFCIKFKCVRVMKFLKTFRLSDLSKSFKSFNSLKYLEHEYSVICMSLVYEKCPDFIPIMYGD